MRLKLQQTWFAGEVLQRNESEKHCPMLVYVPKCEVK